MHGHRSWRLTGHIVSAVSRQGMNKKWGRARLLNSRPTINNTLLSPKASTTFSKTTTTEPIKLGTYKTWRSISQKYTTQQQQNSLNVKCLFYHRSLMPDRELQELDFPSFSAASIPPYAKAFPEMLN